VPARNFGEFGPIRIEWHISGSGEANSRNKPKQGNGNHVG
jgi:hypothetical protein